MIGEILRTWRELNAYYWHQYDGGFYIPVHDYLGPPHRQLTIALRADLPDLQQEFRIKKITKEKQTAQQRNGHLEELIADAVLILYCCRMNLLEGRYTPTDTLKAYFINGAYKYGYIDRDLRGWLSQFDLTPEECLDLIFTDLRTSEEFMKAVRKKLLGSHLTFPSIRNLRVLRKFIQNSNLPETHKNAVRELLQ